MSQVPTADGRAPAGQEKAWVTQTKDFTGHGSGALLQALAWSGLNRNTKGTFAIQIR